MDLFLDSNHDIVIENTDLKLVENVQDSPDETKQAAKVTFLTQRGEWLFDIDFGFPYLQEAFVKNPDLDALVARARIIASGVFGATEVQKSEITLDRETRQMTGYIEIMTDLGLTRIEF